MHMAENRSPVRLFFDGKLEIKTIHTFSLGIYSILSRAMWSLRTETIVDEKRCISTLIELIPSGEHTQTHTVFQRFIVVIIII